GILGEVAGSTLKKFEVRQPTTVAELQVEALVSIDVPIQRAVEQSPYPAVTRDLNLVVDERIRWADLLTTTREAAGSTLEEVDFRATYRDPQRLGAGKKSQLFTITLRRGDGTMTSVEADQVRDQIVAACQQKHGAALRA